MDSADEDEQRPLIGYNEPGRSCWSRIRDPRRFFVVEPLLLLMMSAHVAYFPISNQYIYGRIAHDQFNISFSQAEDEVLDDDCDSGNETETDKMFDQVQAMTSNYMIYLRLADGIPSLFTCLMLGVYSDKAGRRVTLLIPIVGFLCRNLFAFSIIYGNLDLSFFIVGNFLNGCTGGLGLVMTSSLSYITDTVKQDQKGVRLAIIDAILGLATALASLVIGLWIHSVGFVEPMMTVCLLNFTAVLYLVIFVPESLSSSERSNMDGDSDSKGITDFLKSVLKPFTTKDNNWNARMLLIVASAIFNVSVTARSDVTTLYMLNYPLCWDARMSGIFRSTSSVINVATSLTTIRLLKGIVPLSGLIVLGIISSIAASIWQSFSTTSFLMFMVSIIGMFMFMAMPLFQAKISSLTPSEMQGSLFAAMACIDTFMNVVTSVSVTWLYSRTVTFFPGLVFILLACIAAVSLLIVLGKAIADRRRHAYTSLAHAVNDDIGVAGDD